MAHATRRPVCRLSAVNGSVEALVFDVERTLEATRGRDVAEAFAAEVAAYRDRDDATYRGILEVAAAYVELR